jgi:hypothetical protein
MAKQVITVLTDDLDGSRADRTVEFGLDGINYTIDLSDKNAGKLRKALDIYIGAGSRVGRSSTEGRRTVRRRGVSTPTRTDREQNRAIREWAAKNGFEVSDRGRIPSSVVRAYNNRH